MTCALPGNVLCPRGTLCKERQFLFSSAQWMKRWQMRPPLCECNMSPATLLPFSPNICPGRSCFGSLVCTWTCRSELLNGQTGQRSGNCCALVLYRDTSSRLANMCASACQWYFTYIVHRAVSKRFWMFFFFFRATCICRSELLNLISKGVLLKKWSQLAMHARQVYTQSGGRKISLCTTIGKKFAKLPFPWWQRLSATKTRGLGIPSQS